jgi:hypothetical protein
MRVEIIGVERADILRRFVQHHKSSHPSPPRRLLGIERRRVVKFGRFGKRMADPCPERALERLQNGLS